MKITGTTRLCGLIGSPVAHSGSPAMYNYCFEKLGIDMVYLAFDIKQDDVKVMLDAVRLMNIYALNVTMPDKQAVLPYMDELSDAARLVKAVNQIVYKNGRFYGYNTDGVGYVEDLRAHGVEVSGKKIMIVGAGGAATSIIAQCALDQAETIYVMKRKNATFDSCVNKMKEIEEQARKITGREVRIIVEDMHDLCRYKELLQEVDILCNASNVGMAPKIDESIVESAEWLREDLVVSDIVYNPEKTKLLQQAEEAGCKVRINGCGMLVYQGAENFKIFTGMEMPVDEVMKLLYN